MLVTCSACSAKFQLPDDKIAGRRARMKCKTCGAPIAIDGTSLRPHASTGGPPPPPSRRPSAQAKAETLTFTDQTVALGAEEAQALSWQSRQLEAPAPADLEDRITPVSNPRAAALLDDGYVDEAMSALEQKVFSVPAPKPTPASKPAPAAKPAKAPLPAPGPLPAARAPSAPTQPMGAAKAAAAPAAAAPGDDDEATRMMDLPRLLSGAPSPSAPSSPAPANEGEDEATRMLDLGGGGAASLLSGTRPLGETDEATRIFDADPAPRGPRLPPRPSLPRPASAPGSASSPRSTAPESRPPESSPPLNAPAAPPPPISATHNLGLPAADLVVGGAASASTTPPPPSGEAPLGSFPTPDGWPVHSPLGVSPAAQAMDPAALPRRLPELTVQRARLSSAPELKARSNWGLYLFVLALTATTTLVGVYFFARPTFDEAIASTRRAFGLDEKSGAASGPAFDAKAASAELSRVAALAGTCKQPSGPTGAGRARVLFQMSGVASSAAISPPFHASASEACLLGLFKSARVPRFGGHPIIVTKTFVVD